MQQRDHTRLRRFWRRHRGERALLLCNGPSLRQVKFSQINRARFTVFGLNKIFLGFDLLGWEPDYLVAVNEKVLKQSLQMFQTLRMPKFVSNRLPLTARRVSGRWRGERSSGGLVAAMAPLMRCT